LNRSASANRVISASGQEAGHQAAQASAVTPYHLALALANACDDKKACAIEALYVEPTCHYADYMIIVTSDNAVQMMAIANHVKQQAEALGYGCLGGQLDRSGQWTLLDFGDVIVHVLNPTSRQYYGLDVLWQHGEVIPDAFWRQDNGTFSAA